MSICSVLGKVKGNPSFHDSCVYWISPGLSEKGEKYFRHSWEGKSSLPGKTRQGAHINRTAPLPCCKPAEHASLAFFMSGCTSGWWWFSCFCDSWTYVTTPDKELPLVFLRGGREEIILCPWTINFKKNLSIFHSEEKCPECPVPFDKLIHTFTREIHHAWKVWKAT